MIRSMELSDIIKQYPDEEILKADGFDEAVIGYCFDKGEIRLVYSESKCIELLMKDMSEIDSIEYFDYNVSGSYVGSKTPIWFKDYQTL